MTAIMGELANCFEVVGFFSDEADEFRSVVPRAWKDAAKSLVVSV
jgi:hypothetical protein